ncbi:acyl-carrier-protein phosphodiesterase PptH-like [Branchiostoma floridae x Branchiostoma japonicum]
MNRVVSRAMTRILAISDIHVDYQNNLKWVESWPRERYMEDVLLLAGDVTDKLPLLESTLKTLLGKFQKVFYVPGNHELWIRDKKTTKFTSVDKFHQILELCGSLGVLTKPDKVRTSDGGEAWVVPLFSWYATPEEDAEDSLYFSSNTEDADKSHLMWMDNHMCSWPEDIGSRSQFFASQNEDVMKGTYDAPIISFSHFVPRLDLVAATEEDNKMVEDERKTLGLPPLNDKKQGATVGFNFTRYAGCKRLDTQIRTLGSAVHVYGHQHRNRDRVVDGVRYVSHCLGYHREQQNGLTWGLQHWEGPKQVWPPT